MGTQNTAKDIFARHSMVFSNVPGPSQPVLVAGAELTGVQMVYPNLITQVGIISYAGKMYMNFTLDDEIIKRPELIGEYYIEELDKLAALFDLSPESSKISLNDVKINEK